MTRKLCTVLRQPLLPLYNVCLRPALQLSSSVLSTVLGKLYDAHSAEDESLRAAWDATAEVILSGILVRLLQVVATRRLMYPTGFPGPERWRCVYLLSLDRHY